MQLDDQNHKVLTDIRLELLYKEIRSCMNCDVSYTMINNQSIPQVNKPCEDHELELRSYNV
jgi:hypothetical protein